MTPASGRILIADDEPHVLELLRDLLFGEGYDVVTAATGAQVLDAVPTFQPDAIVVDMVMPGLSGRDVLDALRQTGITVPVILVSGRAHIVGDGFLGVLRKPFDLRMMSEVVAAAVGHGRGGGCLKIGIACSSARPGFLQRSPRVVKNLDN